MKKLSTRLQSLFDLIDDNYEVVWDLCCDHGHLGLAVMQSKKCDFVQFVDCVPSIIEKLSETISKAPFEHAYQCRAMSAEDIVVDPDKKNLIIISGVGGKATVSMMKSIISKNGNYDFLLSPKHHLYELRTYLQDVGYGVIRETLSTENGRFYENLLVSMNSSKAVSITGDEMWDSGNSFHGEYLKKLLSHYEKSGAIKELTAYRGLLIEKGFDPL